MVDTLSGAYPFFKSSFLTWVTPVLVHNDQVRYVVGTTGLYQLRHDKVASVQPLSIWEDESEFLH